MIVDSREDEPAEDRDHDEPRGDHHGAAGAEALGDRERAGDPCT